MSKLGYFEHYRVGGAWGRPVFKRITDRPVIDRIASKVPPKLPELFSLGQHVIYEGRPHQVWAQHPLPRYWWLVDEHGQPNFAHESNVRTEQ